MVVSFHAALYMFLRWVKVLRCACKPYHKLYISGLLFAFSFATKAGIERNDTAAVHCYEVAAISRMSNMESGRADI